MAATKILVMQQIFVTLVFQITFSLPRKIILHKEIGSGTVITQNIMGKEVTHCERCCLGFLSLCERFRQEIAQSFPAKPLHYAQASN